MAAQTPNSPPSRDVGEETPKSRNLTETVQETIATLTTTSSKHLNHVLPPQARQQWKQFLTDSAIERPYLASFILCQLVIAGLPVLFIISTAVTFAVMVGIFLASLVGVFFLVAGFGFAVLVVLPAMVFMSSVAVFVWMWVVVGILVLRWARKGDSTEGRLGGEEASKTGSGRSMGLGAREGMRMQRRMEPEDKR